MKKKEFLIILLLTILILTAAGGVVVWQKKILPTPTPTPIPTEQTKMPWEDSVCGNGICEPCEGGCCNYPCVGEACPPPTCLSHCPQDCQEIPSPLTEIIDPTISEPVSPGVFEGDLRDLPTIKPFDITDYYCQTDADCYDEQGKPKGLCEVPCQDKAVCRNGTCFKPGIPGAICLSPNTLIDTPQGPIPVKDLRVGVSVWTNDVQGNRYVSTIIETARTPAVQNHQMIHLLLDDGRKLFASPGHPTADGRRLGDLLPGSLLDGAHVVDIKLIPCQDNYTHDILPEGETGFYWANGILLKSTLAK